MDPVTAKTSIDAIVAVYIAGGVSGGLIAGRILVSLVTNRFPRLNAGNSGLTSKQAEELHDLSTSHGTLGEHLEDILKELRKMNGKLVNVPTLIGELSDCRREEVVAHTKILDSQSVMRNGINSIKDGVGKIKSDVREARADLRDLKKEN